MAFCDLPNASSIMKAEISGSLDDIIILHWIMWHIVVQSCCIACCVNIVLNFSHSLFAMCSLLIFHGQLQAVDCHGAACSVVKACQASL